MIREVLTRAARDVRRGRRLLAEAISQPQAVHARFADDDAFVARAAHAAYYLNLAKQAESYLIAPNSARWVEQLATERANVQLAVTWALNTGHAGAVLRLAGTILSFAYARGEPHEGQQWLEAALAREDAGPPETRVDALFTASALAQVRDLVGSPFVADHSVVIGQVVATETSPMGGRSVTVDVGTRDGVTVDSTVVNPAGLVGRVVAAAPWTSDVQLLGAPKSVVATRVGDRGLLGTVAPVPAGGAGRAGELALTIVQPGLPRVGDVVRTLGSVTGRPYAPGITVGQVVAVDPNPARGTVTARVAPAVELEGIDVVAVLVPGARGEPRPLVRGGTGVGAANVAGLAGAG